MFSFARRSSSARGESQQKKHSGRSSIFSLSRKSSITSFRANGTTSAQSSNQSSAFASGFTSTYNSRPPSAMLPLRHVESNDNPDPAASAHPVSGKAATLLGIASQDAQQPASPVTVKPWFRRTRRLGRKPSQSSMVSHSTADNDDRMSMRRPSESQSRNSTSASGICISGPTDFQHITHARPKHFSKMNLSTSQNELVAEFSAVRASQVPARALQGIKVAEIHSRNSSVDQAAYYSPFAPSITSKGSRESMLSSGISSPTSVQSPRAGQFAESGTGMSHPYLHRFRQPPTANIQPRSPAAASRFSPTPYHQPYSPTSPTNARPDEIGVAVPIEHGGRWLGGEPAESPIFAEHPDGGFHAVSTPGDVSWELGPNSTLPFELMPSLSEEDETNLSRPVSSVTAVNRGSVIHHGSSKDQKRSSAARSTGTRHSAAMREDEPERIVSVIHRPRGQRLTPPPESKRYGQIQRQEPSPPPEEQGLFSAWHADSDSSSVADGEALVALSEGDYRVSAALNAPPSPSPSAAADSWRDSQVTTVPSAGHDDYSNLLDDIIALDKPSAWIRDVPNHKERRRTQSPARLSQANAYPMSPDDGDEDPPFDPYTAPLPRRPDSVVMAQHPPAPPPKPKPKQATASIKSDRTSTSIMSGKDKVKRHSSTSKKVAFAEGASEDDGRRKSSSHKHSRSSSATDVGSSRGISWSGSSGHEAKKGKQRHSTGQVRQGKSSSGGGGGSSSNTSSGHSRKLSAPEAETVSRRSSKRSSSSRGVTTTATNSGYSFVRLSAPPGSTMSSSSAARAAH